MFLNSKNICKQKNRNKKKEKKKYYNDFIFKYILKWVLIILIVSLLFIIINNYFYNPIVKQIDNYNLSNKISPLVNLKPINNYGKKIPPPLGWQSPAETTGEIQIENIHDININNKSIVGEHQLGDVKKLIEDARNVTGDAVSDIDIKL